MTIMNKDELMKLLISGRWLKTKGVINAFRKIPRENFVIGKYKRYAYANEPLPLIMGQTISQPLTVAVMTEAMDIHDGMKVLEIGTGSGYQTAILSELAGKNSKVITIERIKELFDFAKKNLQDYKNTFIIHDNGIKGYEKEAPYDRIIVTASAQYIPKTLIDQLKIGGKLVIPIRDEMFLIEKIAEPDGSVKLRKEFLGNYVFVPLIIVNSKTN
ncbi:MAG: protein-L-isoaspartate(D-aspartate) O-methyltransferase [Candidatus Aenigmatarchaeota archaeon]